MIIATVTALILIFGGGAWWGTQLKSAEDNIKEYLADGPERDAALEINKAMRDIAKGQAKLAGNHGKELEKLLADPTAREADIEPLLRGFRDNTLAFYRDILDQRAQLKSHISREDWQKVFPAPGDSPE